MTIGSIAETSASDVSEAHIQAGEPVPDATTIGYLAIRVLQDPAVHIAWRQAADDCSEARSRATFEAFARAVRSVTRAGSATTASWRRHGRTTPLSSMA